MTDVLIVVAHPDDAEIAMGMRIGDHALTGDHVRVHCLSPGASTPEGAERRRFECLTAGAILGVAQYTFSGIPDNEFTERRVEINRELFRVFGLRRPDAVYTHFPNDQHLDHHITADEVTTVALREADNLYYFRSPYSHDFEPNLHFVGTPDLLAAKQAALACFASQQQLDMAVFSDLTDLAYRQHVHHRVVERFPEGARGAEMFRIARQIVHAPPAGAARL
ncbi:MULTISPECIES: PIG-L deacetylase family protein [unclassified Streptomyces]|uniref:PIG-L deacetylase family protein n=1 Tax=unclassified Streptomyces TaxID=2593676 RepID=UPI00087CDE07|nr:MULTISPECIES: PIG-L family deacetylase [unclassified Streptomyces]REH20634.1 LmbE family N-acetylglucosaminyl deacetylase [Streptomyces sp. 2221.1]SDT30834.1 N-acetylglucosaminyl deacetylase, LmbE family [Streptomyces sp. 2114.2]